MKFEYILFGVQIALPFFGIAWLIVHRMGHRTRKRDRFSKHFEDWQ